MGWHRASSVISESFDELPVACIEYPPGRRNKRIRVYYADTVDEPEVHWAEFLPYQA